MHLNDDVMKVLIIEDNSLIAQFTTRMFERVGMSVSTVSTGKGAISQISIIQPHLILLDIGLPDMSGYDVLKSIPENVDGYPYIYIVSSHLQKTVSNHSNIKKTILKPLMLKHIEEILGDLELIHA